MSQAVKAPEKKSAKNSVASVESNGRALSGGSPVSRDEIARVAYGLFERRGRISGHDREDWLEAERIVKARAAQARR